MNKITLNNRGSVNVAPMLFKLCFPRLQTNKRGEIILATAKNGILTTGILVAKTPESKSTLTIGQQLTDWEVCGELTDYNGEISVTFENQVKV